MTTFSCAVNRKNIGESTCKRGVLQNPNQMMIVDENFTFTAAQANDVSFWDTAIKDKNVTLFPNMFNFEAAPVEPSYEETSFGVSKNSQGKYGWRVFYRENIEVHKNMFSWDGTGDRIILFDDQGAMMSTLVGGEQVDPATNTYTGLRPSLFSVENQTLDENSTKSPIRILFEDHTEWNENGFIFLQTFLNQLKSLTTVDLDEVGVSIATLITATVKSANDGSPVRGLITADFTYTGGSLTGLTELPAGQYALTGVGLATGDLDLVDPTSIAGNQFIESSGLISITI